MATGAHQLLCAVSQKEDMAGVAEECDISPVEKVQTYRDLVEVKTAALVEEAQALRRQGNPRDSLAKLNRALFLDSRNPDLFRERSEAYCMLQDFSNAVINLERVMELSNGGQEDVLMAKIGSFHFYHALQLLEEKKYVEALEMVSLAEDKGFESPQIVGTKVKCLVALRQYTECLRVVEQELEKDPSNVEFIVHRAQLNILFGEVSKGYWDICKALEEQGDHAEALEMKQDLEKKATLSRDKAVHQVLMGKNRDAMSRITGAISTNPSVPDYHIIRGTLHRRKQNFVDAMDDYLTAMDKCGHQQDLPVYRHASRQLVLTYNDFALSCFRKKNFDEAILLLNKAIKEEKREKGLYINRGDCHYRTHKLHFALCDYQQALELAPTEWDIYCRVAVVCSEIGVKLFGQHKFEEAENFFTAAINHNPKVARFYLCRARARLERKNIRGAREDTVSYLTLDNTSSDECIPIIARIFPGKSKEEILWLEPPSKEIQSNLLKVREKMMAPKVVRSSDKTAGSPDRDVRPYAPLQMFSLELKMVEEDHREAEGSTSNDDASNLFLPLDVSKTAEREELIGRSHMISGCSSQNFPRMKLEDIASHREGGNSSAPASLLPLRNCISDPLPPLGKQHQHRKIMPELKDCLQEENFHREIYYSKKYSGDKLKKILEVFPAQQQDRKS